MKLYKGSKNERYLQLRESGSINEYLILSVVDGGGAVLSDLLYITEAGETHLYKGVSKSLGLSLTTEGRLAVWEDK